MRQGIDQRIEQGLQTGKPKKAHRAGYDTNSTLKLGQKSLELLDGRVAAFLERELECIVPTDETAPSTTFNLKKRVLEAIEGIVTEEGSWCFSATIRTSKLARAFQKKAQELREAGDRELALEIELLACQLEIIGN